MKQIVFLLVFLILPSFSFADCVLEKERDGQKLFRCQAPGAPKSVHVLDLKGGFKETAYYHGLFLRSEIEQGVMYGVQKNMEKSFAALDKGDRDQIMMIKKCVMNHYRSSVSEEFKEGLKNQYRGMRDAGSAVPWNVFEESNYMVEFSIFTESMQRSLETDPRKAKLKVFSTCAPYFVGKALAKPFKILAQGLSSIKMGCTGISASASSSMDGALVHGRNFDTGLLGYYEPHQVIIINRQSNGMTSVGLSSAGLHYGGGISGFNSYGLAMSLHQLQTENARAHYGDSSSDIAPFLLNTVLLNAKNLDEAIRIIQSRKGFGAWTFFISDSKTDESASIELSGDTVVVARRAQNKFLGQSNHYIAAATKAEGFEYSMNKTLETRARLAHVSRTLSEDFGRINYQWVIDRLSGHYDELMGVRAFGRTTTKVYTAATHVMIPARQEFWMSLAETYPTNRSHFYGFRLLPPGGSPLEILGTTKAAEDDSKKSWYDSMNYYVLAYLNFEKDKKSLENIDKTLGLLEQASQFAQKSNVYEYTYEFMSARLQVYRASRAILLGQREVAQTNLNQALSTFAEIKNKLPLYLHPYELMQIQMWSFRAETLKAQNLKNANFLQDMRAQAQQGVGGLIKAYPQQNELYDLQWSLTQEQQLDIVLDAEVRFGTVE